MINFSDLTHNPDPEYIEYFRNLMASVPPAVDFAVKHAKDANWDCVRRMMKVLQEDYKKKE